ncbi:zinc dependent phospholipase C family protein [Desulforamulus aquiferis]|uniref:Phospholipase C n=1 Tax=Desulforamulus aquiferis TaxID=1397668 RepID=A0AAW7Z9F1_9FIRM|nr:zinc dependent phospholipase C family protein [Desulforamulus aquiferis]MDO7786368.1 zinc dependent phospholipase C family protein [Desulforamulus aquiferis]RYD06684.1 hypothetical protein N752_03145 [Desulforamulus aquiferis]
MTLSQATWNCTRLMLNVALPIKAVINPPRKRNTHRFCNLQAIGILKRDGLRKEALLLQSGVDSLNEGAIWCDTGFKYISHYYNPHVGAGLWNGPDAPTECQSYFNRAVEMWRRGYREQAIFYLGAATHIMQDLCVPHHASGLVFNGHQYFEYWARKHYEDFAINSCGIYKIINSASDWVRENAFFSSIYLPTVSENAQITSIEKTVEILLERAQRTTAGFLHLFCKSVLN